MFARRVAHHLFLLLRYQACPSLIIARSEGGNFFISSVEDSVLERRAALESLCLGIGFSRLELNCTYNFYITVLCFYIVLYICICLPYEFFGNQTTAHTVEKVCAAASLAIPSLHGLSSSIVKLVAELSLTFKSIWQAALCQPRVSAAVE